MPLRDSRQNNPHVQGRFTAANSDRAIKLLDIMRTDIDITFDFRQDTPANKDPDTYSERLRQYHKLLWSKQLPNGSEFTLEYTRHRPPFYLQHQSHLGEFVMSSDAVIPTFRWNERIQTLIPADELESFNAAGYTIGGMMIFPAFQIDRKWTINQARGCNSRIRDRFDLTLECIRRYYNDKNLTPKKTLWVPCVSVMHDFFDLFVDFRGYVEFFLLQDLVADDCSSVKIAAPFDDFNGSPIPNSRDEYKAYESAAHAFIEARNQRILKASQRTG